MATVRVTAKIEGMEQFRSSLGARVREFDEAVADAVNATGLELRGDIIKRYNRGPTTGRTYEKYKPRRTHRASAPGEAPQSDTGRLAAATVYRDEGDSAVVENRVKYSRALEFGTSRIRPRPAWRPAAERARRTFTKRIREVVARFAR